MPLRFSLKALAAATLCLFSRADAQSDPAVLRARMVSEVEAMYAEHGRVTGVPDMSPAVRAALGRVERHRFVPARMAADAYANRPLPIGSGQTISQPYIVALSTDLAAPRPGHVVLEVGTGSGYQAAMLAEIVGWVYSIELVPGLGREAAALLKKLGYTNVEVRVGDGYKGWPDRAPFDAIVVTAAAPQVPPELVAQLKPGGRMVIPVGERGKPQVLTLIVKRADGSVDRQEVLPVMFVPLVPAQVPARGR
jgi:protein-L-isoaspartate(D-aspartate) O-methyltransferase